MSTEWWHGLNVIQSSVKLKYIKVIFISSDSAKIIEVELQLTESLVSICEATSKKKKKSLRHQSYPFCKYRLNNKASLKGELIPNPISACE